MCVMREQMGTLPDNELFLQKVFSKHVTSAILSMFGAMASVIANSVIAGIFFGSAGLALMSVLAPAYSLFAALGSLVGVGGSIAAAHALGRDDMREANAIFCLSVALGMVLSLAVGLLAYLGLDHILLLFGCTPDLYAEARIYGTICLLGGFGTTMFYLPYNFLKLVGRLRLLIVLFLGMAAANVLLDLLFVRVCGGGMAGIAIGTLLASAGASLIGILLLMRGRDGFRWELSPERARIARIVQNGTPSALNNLLIFLRLLLMNQLIVAVAGSAGLVVFSVVTAFENFTLVLLGGLAQATSGFISVFSQEMDTVSVRRIEKQAHGIGIGLMLAVMALIFLFPNELCRLFGIGGTQELGAAAQALFVFSLSLLPTVSCYLLFFYYQSAGFTRLANGLIFCKSFLFMLVPAWILAHVYGLDGIWYAYLIAALAPLGIVLLVRPYYQRDGRVGILFQDLRAERDGRYLSFSIPPNPQEIVASIAEIGAFCARSGVRHKDNLLVSLAVEEMLMSIVEHSFTPHSDATVDVRILIVPEAGALTTVLRIRHAGKLFNPIDHYEHQKEQDPLALGDALGIAMILRAAEAIYYKTTFGINNLTVVMRCDAAAE